MECLDPTLDLVFKLLLTREPALLHDMVESILARPIARPTIIDPHVLGPRVDAKGIIFDIRAVLDDGSRVDLEMQRRATTALDSRLVYYTARNHSDQVNRGDEYHLITPTTGIIWLVEPLVVSDHLHSIYELRERHTGHLLSDQLTIHLLQLSSPRMPAIGYTARVHRWARFFLARTDAERRTLAAEHPIMTLAKQALEQLSMDPQARRLAREREDEIKLHKIEQFATMKVGMGHALMRQLERRFGPLPEDVQALVWAAPPPILESWIERVLTADTLDQVIGSRTPYWAPEPGEPRGRNPLERVVLQAQGEIAGQAKLLLKLLGRRFGSLPERVQAHIGFASSEQLEAWAERVLTANTLDQVFAPLPVRDH